MPIENCVYQKLQSPCAGSGRALQLLHLQKQSLQLLTALGDCHTIEPSVRPNYLDTLSSCQYKSQFAQIHYVLSPGVSATSGSESAWTSCTEYTEAKRFGKPREAIVAACDMPAGMPPAIISSGIRNDLIQQVTQRLANVKRRSINEKRLLDGISPNRMVICDHQITGWAELWSTGTS